MILTVGSLLVLALAMLFFGGWHMGGSPLSGLLAIAGALMGGLIYSGADKLIRKRKAASE